MNLPACPVSVVFNDFCDKFLYHSFTENFYMGADRTACLGFLSSYFRFCREILTDDLSAFSGGNHDVRAPPHLFASLSRHGFGSSLLIELNVVDSLMEILSSNQDPASVKAALMALGHIGSSDEGRAHRWSRLVCSYLLCSFQVSSCCPSASFHRWSAWPRRPRC